jgi:hypothetical protein
MVMKTLTIKVDENSKKGKAFLEFIEALFSEKGDVQLIAIDAVPINNSSESDFNSVAESGAKYKTSRKTKKEIKEKVDSEESPYNPEFVKMVLDSAKSKNRTRVTAATLWEDIQ